MRLNIEHPNSTSSDNSIPPPSLAFMPVLPMPEDLPKEPIAISDMANLFGVTHRTLHFYEEKKCCPPAEWG